MKSMYFTLIAVMSFIYVAPVQAAYEQMLYYSGVSCSKVQKDSIASPSNEIFINTYVLQSTNGQLFQKQLPSRNKAYTNVKNGFVNRKTGRLLWRGKPQNLTLRVAMWEYDNGGQSIDVASQVLSKAIIASLARKGQPRPKGVSFKQEKDPLANLFSKGYRRLLGANNDLIGYAIVKLNKSKWSDKPYKKASGIAYHFVTRHRRAGADCKSYFFFKRGKKYTEQPKEDNQKNNAGTKNKTISKNRATNQSPAEYYPHPMLPGHRVSIHNHCKKKTLVAYSYRSLQDQWIIVGWLSLNPGQNKTSSTVTKASVMFISATVGKLVPVSGRYSRQHLPVTDTHFKYDYNQKEKVTGPGLRKAYFYPFAYPESKRDVTANIVCK